MHLEQMLVAGGTLGTGVGMLAQQIVDDGGTPTIAVQGVLLSVGVALFVFFDRRERAAQRERNMERREADVKKDEEIERLRAEVRELNARIYRLLRGRGDDDA